MALSPPPENIRFELISDGSTVPSEMRSQPAYTWETSLKGTNINPVVVEHLIQQINRVSLPIIPDLCFVEHLKTVATRTCPEQLEATFKQQFNDITSKLEQQFQDAADKIYMEVASSSLIASQRSHILSMIEIQSIRQVKSFVIEVLPDMIRSFGKHTPPERITASTPVTGHTSVFGPEGPTPLPSKSVSLNSKPPANRRRSRRIAQQMTQQRPQGVRKREPAGRGKK